MFYSRFIPVNVGRNNTVIYTYDKSFPLPKLRQAVEALTTGAWIGQTMLLENNCVKFFDSDVIWTIPEVYLAWEYYQCAERSNFSFYAVFGSNGIPQLFISKLFKGHRLMVNAFTFDTVIVTKENLVKRVGTLVDKKLSSLYCMDVFNVIQDLERNASKYLEAIIVSRGDEEEECMLINPVTSLYSESNNIYSKAVIEDYRTLLEDPDAVCDDVEISTGFLSRKNVGGFTPVTFAHARSVVSLYDRVSSKKCNYLAVMSSDFTCPLYVSTNWRYLVNANTFECIVITNDNLRKLIQNYVTTGETDTHQLHMCWEIAKSRPE